jgi:hypothetical protein
MNTVLNKVGKWILPFIIPLLLVSCTTPIPESTYGVEISTYHEYLRVKDVVTTDNVIALLSYSSAIMNSNTHSTWADVEKLLRAYDTYVVKNKVISNNYPVSPSSSDLAIFRKFYNSWLRAYRDSSVAPSSCGQYYAQDASRLVFKMSDSNYNRFK